jgi:acyl carrier protein
MQRVGFLLVFSVCALGCDRRSGTDNKSHPDTKPQTQQPEADEVERVVRQIVSDHLRVDPQSLDMKKAIADELDVVDIVMTLEEQFTLEIPDRVIAKHTGARFGDPKCKPSPAQLVEIVRESRQLSVKK